MTTKRLLVLTPRFPYPAIGGDRIRILHMCRALSEHFRLTLLSLCETRTEMEYEPRDGTFAHIHRVRLARWRSCLKVLRALPSSRPLQVAYYDCPEFRAAARSLAAKHDLVLAHLIRTAEYAAECPQPRILEMTDAISMNYLRMRHTPGNRSWRKLVYLLEQPRVEAYERDVMERFDRVWLASHTDRRFLDPQRERRIEVIPNGAELDRLPFRPPVDGGHAIIFIGNMVSEQNQDACHSFLREIFPRVRQHARLTFRIVGNAPPAVRRQFARYDGVEMTGRIEHIRDGVAGAFCAVCPLRAGAGIQNKLLEYLALGLPCVTSQVGLGGVEAQHGAEVLVYREAAEAASQILQLFDSSDLRMRLAVAGRELVDRRYDWKTIYREFAVSALQTVERGGAQPVSSAA